MIVWRIIGNEVGPNGNGAVYFATKAEAERARRDIPGDEPMPELEKIIILNRKQLVCELNDAMGFGAS